MLSRAVTLRKTVIFFRTQTRIEVVYTGAASASAKTKGRCETRSQGESVHVLVSSHPAVESDKWALQK